MGLRNGRNLLMMMDALLVAASQPLAGSVGREVRNLLGRRERSFHQVISGARLLDRLLPGSIQFVAGRIFETGRLPLRCHEVRLLDYGTGATVFLVRLEGQALVVRIYRRAFGGDLGEVLQVTGEYRHKYDVVRDWYAHPDFQLVPPMHFLALHGFVLGRPAAASTQVFIPEPRQDLTGLTNDHLVRLAAQNRLLSRQLSFFIQKTLAAFHDGRNCLDLVGRGNLVLAGPAGAERLTIIDTGMFELPDMQSRAPDRHRALMKEIRKLQDLGEKFDVGEVSG